MALGGLGFGDLDFGAVVHLQQLLEAGCASTGESELRLPPLGTCSRGEASLHRDEGHRDAVCESVSLGGLGERGLHRDAHNQLVVAILDQKPLDSLSLVRLTWGREQEVDGSPRRHRGHPRCGTRGDATMGRATRGCQLLGVALENKKLERIANETDTGWMKLQPRDVLCTRSSRL